MSILLMFICVWLLLLCIVLGQIHFFKKEIDLLPLIESGNFSFKDNNLIGVNMKRYFLENHLNFEDITIVAFTSTTCPFCKQALIEMIEENNGIYKIPLINIEKIFELPDDNKGNTDYKDIVKIQENESFFTSLDIDTFPTFTLIDNKGTIIYQNSYYKGIFSHYEKIRNIKEDKII
ncbi:thioredoxin fold domain-containing protein [Bacillus sp. 123MFChir2]|uniref:thioredoxin fold domain-containing protein n=1 Tax=Bacillus sp. 123MFChir2 TaxID=1169144 RepID=UPI0003720964|nr:thioredoxin fold domain-containing protein [Bacillus sp. 123MFChir2]